MALLISAYTAAILAPATLAVVRNVNIAGTTSKPGFKRWEGTRKHVFIHTLN